MKAEEFTHAGFSVSIHYMEDAESPREWDNLGTMICGHRRYNLGDEQIRDTENFQEELERRFLGGEVLPLFLYDHSGLTLSTKPFSCPWDSGQVGVIAVTAADIRKEYGVKRITKQTREKVRTVLKQEVETYDQFLRGDVYGYVIENEQGEHIDSCWGFYGIEHVTEEAKRMAEYFAAQNQEEAA